jgi:putative tryptophan/tyrosine transport system substrate-binding protein
MRNSLFGFVTLATLVAGALGSPVDAAPDDRKVWKVGLLWHAANLEEEAVMFGPFAQGMRELGYVEGQNLILEHTFVDEKYNLFQARAEELLSRKVDLILASVAAAASAAAKLTKTVPIVFATSGDPVKLGLVESIRRPGRNLTGLTLFAPELTLKHLELLREFVPGLSRVAVLWNPSNDDHPATLNAAERAAQSLNLQMVAVGAKGPEEFAGAFAAIEKAEVGGFIVLVDSMLRVNRKSIVAFAARSRLPAVYATRDYVEAGGLMSYGACVPCNFRRSAKYVDDIFKGAKPADLPVQQPAKFDTLINLKTAKALGLDVPPSILLRADEVIE